MIRGRVVAVGRGVVKALLPYCSIGNGVAIASERGIVTGTVEATNGRDIDVAMHQGIEAIAPGHAVWLDASAPSAPAGLAALGRAFDGAGHPLDGKPPLPRSHRMLETRVAVPGERKAIDAPFWTGLSCIDGLLTLGAGARVGIFGGPGTGKSTLLHEIAGQSSADACVVALIGERGREARDWMEALPPHATMYCATSDRSAYERVLAARAAAAQASALQQRGLNVLLLVDSLARFAAAYREIALARGERTGRGGYPPRVFSELASFTERAGRFSTGSITLVASVLNDGDDRDPVSEASRALLDGHIQLSRELAAAGKFPAIDPLASASRSMSAVASTQQLHDAAIVRDALAELERTKDARAIGIVPSGTRAVRAAAAEQPVESFLRRMQRPASTLQELRDVAAMLSAE